MQITARQAAALHGIVEAPADKSIAHRAAILNALCEGRAELTNYLAGRDTHLTLRALRQLGVRVETPPGRVIIDGCGRCGFREPLQPLYVGRSATTMRFLAGLVAASPITTMLTGTRRSNVRPMGRIAKPLRTMGASVMGRTGDLAPLSIRGGVLRGIHHHLEVASGEAKTAVMLAALQAEGETLLTGPEPSRDHTENMLRAMGAVVHSEEASVRVQPMSVPLRPLDMRIPGEISVAVYWLVTASVHPDAEVLVRNVCVNPTRTGLLDVLGTMGADIEVIDRGMWGPEPVADIRVRSARLTAAEIGPELVPRMIDEFPGFVLAAAMARGRTRIAGADELRRKKSDRISSVIQEYRRLGVEIEERPDGMVITGGRRLRGARCRAHGDHRLASSLAFAGLVADGTTSVDGAELVERVSYPTFMADVNRVARARDGARAVVAIDTE